MRRTHTKSRTGCTNCKRRKVKCDEAYPVCFNCKRLGTTCSLADHARSRHETESASSNTSIATPITPASEAVEPADGSGAGTPTRSHGGMVASLAEQIAPIPHAELLQMDFELMHHYCTITAESISFKPEVCQVWRLTVPREGYRHAYVRHGILATAATHKAHMFPYSRKKYLAVADYHQTLGSEEFRMALETAEPEHAVALFAFASLLVLHMLALPGRCAEGRLSDPIGHFMELSGMCRGLMGTISPLFSKVLQSELAPLVYSVWPLNGADMPDRIVSLEHSFLPPDTWQAIQALRSFLSSDLPSSGTQDYIQSIKNLEDVAKLIALGGAHAEFGAVMAWIPRTKASVLSDIGARRQHALLLLSYYCVLFATTDERLWFAKGWARPLFDAVEGELAAQTRFAELLEWPRRNLACMGV